MFDIYEDTPNNADMALTRISSCRGSLANELLLRENNKRIFSGRGKTRVHRAAFDQIRARLTDKLKLLRTHFEEVIGYAATPHPKIKLRMKSMCDLLNSAALEGLYTTKIAGKTKLFERAKPGKYPRYIGDYSCPGSLLAGYLCELAKKSFETFKTSDGKFTATYSASSDAHSLDCLGEQLHHSSNTFVYFSDDSVLKLNGQLFEIDISSCDKSNTQTIFDIVEHLFGGDAYFQSVISKNIKQCALPLRHTNPHNKSIGVNLKPAYPIEFSGSTLTTLLNNIASLSIGLNAYLSGCSTSDDVIQSAIAVGYDVTCSARSSLPKTQFLKHSWFVDVDKNIVCSFTNLGTMMRSFGTCAGDLPGAGNIFSRARIWNSAVTKGYKHAGTTRWLEVLTKVFDEPLGKLRLPFEIEKHFSSSSRYPVPDSVVLERYGFTSPMWDHFIKLCEVGCGSHSTIRHPVLDIIFLVDYGLDPRVPDHVSHHEPL